MRKIALVSFIFFTNLLISQNVKREIDSIKKVINFQQDTILIQSLDELSWLYKRVDLDSSLYFAKRALFESKLIANPKAMALSYNSLGTIFEGKSMLDSALYYHKKSLEIKSKLLDSVGMANTFNNLGIIHDEKGEYLKSLQNYFKALKIYENSTVEFDKIPMVLVNIGIVYKKQKNYQKVLDYYLRALKIYNENNYKIGSVITTGNIGGVYLELREFEKAIAFSERAKKGYQELSYEIYMPYMDHNIARAKDGLQQYLESRKIYESIIPELKSQEAYFELVDAKINLAKNYGHTKDYRKAIGQLEDGLKISQNNEFKEKELRIFKLLSTNYSSIGQYRRAHENLKTYLKKKDSVFEKEKTKAILELETKYQTEKKEKELLQTRTEKAETELELSKSQNYIYILLAVLALAAGTFITVHQRNKRKTQARIAQEKERGFKAIIEAQEQERGKIARELHDGVVQQIGSVILKSRNLFKQKDIAEDKEAIEVLQSLENSTNELRTISHQMMPRALKELGIIAALQDLLEGSLAYSKINFSLEHFNIDQRLPEKIEVTIYRITQELINNIVKHSRANQVSVQLFKNNNAVILIVEDNGIGFSPKDKKKGIGLLNIASRLDMVKGDVNFEPSPNSGTLVTVNIPL